MYFTFVLASFTSLLAFIPSAFAGFSSSSKTNIAIYWGQNSYGQGTGPLAQQRLSYYCANTEFNVSFAIIIPIAFLITIANPSLNFANAGDNCTTISGSNLFYCPQLEQDIATCQSTYGKTILLSIGGATYTEGGFSSSAAAVTAANNIWSIFGPRTSSSSPRPFGSSVIDGFDFDFESSVSNMVPFATQLRSLMTASTISTGKKYLLTAAPQCPYPDAADGPMLAGAVYFDAIWVQFYNNYCGLPSFTIGSSTQNNFNIATWDNWAKTVSLNPNVKIILGIPAAPGGGSGYQSGSTLASIIAYCKGFSSFGGVMMWDMSQLYSNPGFLHAVSSDLGLPASGGGGGTTTSATATTLKTVTKTTTTTTAAASTATRTVGQWSQSTNMNGQCGGIGYTGSTVCTPPYVCVVTSVWWAQCNSNPGFLNTGRDYDECDCYNA
ncbi:glycoside hydrolase family 18 protein [Hyaloscypha sp. PMI_1271]|nr:glycoside hydrolase family 18 protein [Hyaloscypha sp. PMI_1271]